METLKKIVTNQYFPAAAVLAAVLIYWTVGFLGGLSLLHNNQPPLTTLSWLLFVYASVALTPLAAALAVLDLVRRWRRSRAGAAGTEAPEAAPRPEPLARNQSAPNPEPEKTAAAKAAPAKAASPKAARKKSGTKKAA